MNRRLALLLALFPLVLSILSIWWAKSPVQYQTAELTLDEVTFSQQAARIERQRVRIEIPAAIRFGDQAAARVYLEPESGEENEAQEFYIDARLEVQQAGVEPQGNVREAVKPGSQTTFFWMLQPVREGRYRGTMWLYYGLRDGQERLTMLARPVEFECVSCFHIPTNWLFWGGIVGISFSFVLSLQTILFNRILQDKL